MSIVKSKYASNFTVLPNEIFKQGLSLQAIGLLSYLLSLPYDWVIQKGTLHLLINEGKHTLITAFNELKDKGYILSIREYDAKGYASWNHIVYDKPFNGEPNKINPTSENPTLENPTSGFPTSENQSLISTNKKQSTNKKLNTNNTVYSTNFENFWNTYDKKVGDKEKIYKKFNKLTNEEVEAIMINIPLYKQSQPDKSYRKNPETYLNNKSWKDEIIFVAKFSGAAAGQVPKVETSTNEYSKKTW